MIRHPDAQFISSIAKHQSRAIDPVIAQGLAVLLQPKGRAATQDPAIRVA
ncbi:hypothetical protein Pan181_41720 [Aeoliella mucimassa]|uniref:Uncharacterized protein n=1 Tax=Aeoliella mucimassa TaxID=2527972 RepID=A0A518ATA9_9BACT|nr:hypothetical protein Pan181_41720 [Aeoliella mucimassa]